MPRNRLQLRFLSEEALDQIEETAYRLLDEVGISLQHAVVTEMLHGYGCRIEKDRVFIPRDVVQWALNNVTAHTEVFNRDGSGGSQLHAAISDSRSPLRTHGRPVCGRA